MQELFRAEPLLLIGIILVVGYYLGRVARLGRLPSLIGFMVLGVVLGPSLLGYFYDGNLASLSFITEMALGFVAFSIGSELSMRSLKDIGGGVAAIIFAESFGAFIVVTAVVFLITRSWPVAILFGAVAPASAPAGTVAVIHEYKAKGTLTKALYAVVGFDDGLAILIFGFAAALAKMILVGQLVPDGGASVSFLGGMREPALEIVGSLALGTTLGFVYCLLVNRLKAARDTLIMTFGIILVATGISEHFGLSLILTNMAVGFVLVNTRREALVHRVTEPLRNIMPLLFILFFCIAGAHLRLSELPKLGAIGIAYILARSAGLIGGSRLGARLGKAELKIRKWVGLGILSQAGVAIGLSLIAQHEFRALAEDPRIAHAIARYAEAHPAVAPIVYSPLAIGAAIITVITATSIVFEIVGPILTKIALTRAGEIDASD